ncbi:MAG TPA: molecular chaperone DnaJ [Gemmatimonadaceae bacterium]|nr:molecular chaperone DnaJ [Gemmatimonadaceae bacterium]
MADFYSILSVDRTASDDEIKQSYRRLAMQYHPDKNAGSKESEEKFKQISEAYDVLRDPQKRAAYDRYGEAGLRGGGGGGAGGFHHVDLSEALNIFMRDFGLGDLFGGAQRQQTGPRSGADLKIDLRLTLSEVATGVTKEIKIKLLDPCDRCKGVGAEPGTKPARCSTCGGHGEVRRQQRSFFGQFVSVAPCPTCGGEGVMISSPCKSCRGEGRQRGEHTIPINIPAGVSTGQYMHLRGVGNAGARGGPRGDLVVLFEVDDDERFERDGEDLYTEVLLTFPQAVRGADVEVAGIAGPLTLHIPAGTQSGQIFQLRGRGLPRVNASGTGDLHVRVQLWTPTDLTADEKRVIDELAKVHSPVPMKRDKGFWAKMKEALGA